MTSDDEAVAYYRVSTKDQATRGGEAEGFSIPAQREACHRKASSLGAIIAAEFTDAGESAKTADRDDLKKMLVYLTEHPVKYVIVHKIDRLARNRRDDVELTLAIREAGATLVSCTENIDETPSGMLLHGIMSSIAEFYSRNLATEVVKGMKQKVQNGGTPTRAPIGYMNVRKIVNGVEARTVEVDPERGPLIAWAFETYATGNWSTRKLAAELEQRGLTQRPSAKRATRPLPAKELSLILHLPYYKGIVTWKGVQFEGKHERLVTPEVWDKVQEVLEAHRQSGERSYRRRHYLAGSLYCGYCNSRLILSVSTGRQGGRYSYWCCNGRHSYRNGCELPYIPTEVIEDLVERQWQSERLSETQAEKIHDGLLADLDDYKTASSKQHADIERKIEAIQRERRTWAEKAMNGAVPDDIAREEQEKLGARLGNAERKLASLCLASDEHSHVIETATALLPLCGEAYRRGGDKLKREYNQAWFKKIYISSERGEHQIARVERTEPIEALMSATVHDEPQETTSFFQQVLDNEQAEHASQSKGRGSLRCRVLTNLAGISHAVGSNFAVLVGDTGLEYTALK